MASASSSLHSSLCFSAPHTKHLLTGHPGASYLILPRHPLSRSVLTFSRRRNQSNSANTPSSSSKKKKKNGPKNDVKKEDDLNEDAFEALFSQLEEDLKNDDLFGDDGDEEISEADLAMLERELEEALGDDELVGLLGSIDDDESKNDIEEQEQEDDNGDDDEEEDKEEPVKLKSWQLRRLAHALKNGRRKISIKNLAAEVCLDRAVVLELLRDPPPNLLMMSASLPDKPVSTIVDIETKHEETVETISPPETEPIETISLEAAMDVEKPDSEVKEPIHDMQARWSSQKRLKKVQVETLERVYGRTKRPTNTMISSIVHVTNLPRKRVVKWFEDKRSEDGVPDNRHPYQRSAPETVFTS